MNHELGKTAPAATAMPTMPPVPLDAELQVAYDAYVAAEPESAPMSHELLAKIRAEVDAGVAGLGELGTDLGLGGRFTVSQPSVPGLDGDPRSRCWSARPSARPRPVRCSTSSTAAASSATTTASGSTNRWRPPSGWVPP